MAYVLLMLMWVPSQQTSGAVGSAEFNSLETCQAAAKAAKSKFEGPLATLYFVCVPK